MTLRHSTTQNHLHLLVFICPWLNIGLRPTQEFWKNVTCGQNTSKSCGKNSEKREEHVHRASARSRSDTHTYVRTLKAFFFHPLSIKRQKWGIYARKKNPSKTIWTLVSPSGVEYNVWTEWWWKLWVVVVWEVLLHPLKKMSSMRDDWNPPRLTCLSECLQLNEKTHKTHKKHRFWGHFCSMRY